MTSKLKLGYTILGIGISILLAFGIFKYFSSGTKTKSNSRSFLNLDSSVKYVGDKECVSCHSGISESFHQSGMGRSFYLMSQETEVEDFVNQNVVYDSKNNFYYEAFKTNEGYFIREYRLNENGDIIHSLTKKIYYVIGSGKATRSYITVENGFFFEMPITWFSQKAKWDLSPGFEKHNPRFSRTIIQECMNCHNSYSNFVKYSENKFDEPVPHGIGCERCHGPGELHVNKYRNKDQSSIDKDTIDRTIVNPAALSTELQNDVCFQCHLQGEVRVFKNENNQNAFKPGMRLSDHRLVYVEDKIDEGSFKIASHGERFASSKCYIESKNKFTCFTCHDPHEDVKYLKQEFVNRKCQICHDIPGLASKDLKVKHTKESDCVSCHMKQSGTKDVMHVNFTDHWIRKYPDEISKTDTKPEDQNIAKTLKEFPYSNDSLANTYLGIAYLNLYDKHILPEYLQRAEALLSDELKRDLNSVSAQYYLGIAYLKQNKFSEAQKVLEKLKSSMTSNANFFSVLGELYEKQKSVNKAIESYDLALQIFPFDYKNHNSVGNIFTNIGKTNDALNSYFSAIKILPGYAPSLNNLGDIYLYKLDNIDLANKYFQDAVHNDPDFFMALFNLGNTYMIKDNLEEAEKYFRKAFEVNPNSVLPYGNLALINERKGNIAEARKLLIKVLELDSNDVRAKEMLARLK